ncbi:MAG TPA: hypothetical protein VMR96_08680 [Solirubrobacterales bacterium]|nr:hypothetical protein [Solirubrobacterales bacterium]
MTAMDSLGAMDPRVDPAAAEFAALLQAKSLIRYAKEAREVEEGWREEEERRLDVWRKYEAAIEAKVRTQNRVMLWALLVANFVAAFSISLFCLIRGLL